jgi:hypothetical protein
MVNESLSNLAVGEKWSRYGAVSQADAGSAGSYAALAEKVSVYL